DFSGASDIILGYALIYNWLISDEENLYLGEECLSLCVENLCLGEECLSLCEQTLCSDKETLSL
ncbi:MAG: hypothetical protein LBC41_08815, partial [Clostridiales bacterium]|nr:hypothetical protein [Clostridiales bacterium]